ncbi:MAG TPA: AMP-binding protein [Acidimicrobiales bacterium]
MSGYATTPAPSSKVPAPGQMDLPAPDAAALIRRNVDRFGDRLALRFDDAVWTHAEYATESCRWANLFLAHRPAGDRPFHVAVLMDNTPDYLFALGGAALSGATIVGLNHTRVGEALHRDLTHTHCGIVITETRHQGQLADALGDDPVGGTVLVSDRFDDGHSDEGDGTPRIGTSLAAALDAQPATDPGLEPGASTAWTLIFTSGTSSAPKAVICSQRRLMGTGARLGLILEVTADDVGYVSMPLFHSNALMVGWAPAVVYGASVGLRRRFSASGFLPDVRRYGATWFNYTGKPLSYVLGTERAHDDADNTLRVAYGNEGSPQVVAEFAERFGVKVIDAFGATEGGVAIDRDASPRSGALGRAGATVRVVDDSGVERPVARFDEAGRLINAEECVGEIVSTAGAGPFEGYYNNPEATERATRGGWFWSGDLGYLDTDGYLYFAGRNADWIRVDGENFPAGPIAAALQRHRDVAICTVYGVPDEQAGDQVMAAIILREGATFDPVAFAEWIDSLDDVGPKWRPRYLRIATELPTTGTNKVVTRTLVHHKFRPDRCGPDHLYVRDRGDDHYRPFTADDAEALRARFAAAGRSRFWDL